MGIDVSAPPLDHAETRNAAKRMVDACRKAGKFAAAMAPTGDQAAAYREMGYQLLVGGADTSFIRSGAEAKLAELKQALGN
jgi:2-keto-3-deoxy-L-rhamnonate aldolase RhmA